MRARARNTPENGNVGSRRISANGNGSSVVGDIDSNGDGVLVVCSRDDGDGGCNDESGDNRGATTVSGIKRN